MNTNNQNNLTFLTLSIIVFAFIVICTFNIGHTPIDKYKEYDAPQFNGDSTYIVQPANNLFEDAESKFHKDNWLPFFRSERNKYYEENILIPPSKLEFFLLI